MESDNYFTFENFRWHYRVYGQGASTLIALHGFDRSGHDFEIFKNSLGNHFTIYAFDLIHHGNSCLINTEKKNNTLTKQQFCDLFQHFLSEHKVNQFSLIGYSMGGRLSLCLIEMMPGKIEHAFLMAPDGMVYSIWNGRTLRSSFGKNILSFISVNPKPALLLIQFLGATKLMHPKVVHYLTGQLSNENTRMRIYKSWLVFHDLVPDLDQVKKFIFRYNINLQMVFGQYDDIIPVSAGVKFEKRFKNRKIVHVVPCGHKLFSAHETIAEIIIKSVLSKK